MASEQASSVTLEFAQVNKILGVGGMIPIVDRYFGDGYSLSLGEGDQHISMQVFPQEKAVRTYMGTSSLEIGPVTDLLEHDGRLLLASASATETSVLEVSPTGTVVFTRTPSVRNAGEILAAVAVDKNSQHRRARAEGTAGTETPRVTLAGRVGAEPRFRTTQQNGRLIGRFPIAVHEDPLTTRWFTVLAFDDRAKRLQEKGLVKGQPVEIVGYLHTREGRTRRGDTRIVEEIYAAAIRTTLSKPPLEK